MERRTKNEERPGFAGALRRGERTKVAHGAAFTLLEVILAMGIVTMLVLMIANMFQGVTFVWNTGTQSAEMNTAGRSAVDFIARELAQAVAGPIEAANPNPSYPAIKFLLQDNGNELRFVALSGDPNDGRALRGAMFKFEDGKLQYCRKTDSIDPYSDDPGTWNWQGVKMLVTNVIDFQLAAYSNANDLINNNSSPDYDSSSRLPLCVDIYLAVLGNDDAKKANNLSGADKTAFEDRNTRRYATRVYFNNRQFNSEQ